MSARDALAEDTLRRYALPLVAKVADEDPEEWGPWLAAIPADRVRVMAILLAELARDHAGPGCRLPVDQIAPSLGLVCGGVVDLVAVRRALSGRDRPPLTSAEVHAAICIGTQEGMSGRALRFTLGVSERTVTRHRRRHRLEVAA